MIYLIGSLRNPLIPAIRHTLEQALDVEVFASWFAAGEIADDRWRDYERGRGLTYQDAIKDYAARHIVDFDLTHLRRCKSAVLIYPASRSGHLELGHVLGQGKPGYVVLDQEEPRWDVMLGLATGVYGTVQELIEGLKP